MGEMSQVSVQLPIIGGFQGVFCSPGGKAETRLDVKLFFFKLVA